MRYGWHIDSAAWKLLDLQLNALTWVRKPFNESFAYQVPQKSGVYIICARTPIVDKRPHTEFRTVIYAGRTEANLQQRFLTHLKNPKPRLRDAIACFAVTAESIDYYYAEAPAQEVAELESRLIECYGPPGNSQSGDFLVLKAKLRYDKCKDAG